MRFFVLVFIVVMATQLSGCNLAQTKDGVADNLRELDSAPNSVMVTHAPSVVEQMLDRADTLFQEGRLLSADGDSAYIRYRAVMMFDAENAQAKSGLDAILIHELDGVRDLMAASKLRGAKQRVGELEMLFPGAALLEVLKKDIAAEQLAQQKRMAALAKKRERSVPAGEVELVAEDDKRRILLDETMLREKHHSVVAQLTGLAETVERADQGVLIYARSDAEGRWIYQQMRKATPNYRIRGDIRIGKPAIKLLAPFGE